MITKEECILAIQDFYALHNRIPATKDKISPSYSAIKRCFGTWAEAIKAAGFAPKPYTQAHSKENKELEITIKEYLEYDPDTGHIYWKKTRSNKTAGSIAGTLNKGYLRICLNKKIYPAHRIAWFLYYGKWPKNYIDHIDGNRANNRINNLRDIETKVNNLHRLNTNNIRKLSDGYCVRITLQGKDKYIGRYDSEQEAIEAAMVIKAKIIEDLIAGNK